MTIFIENMATSHTVERKTMHISLTEYKNVRVALYISLFLIHGHQKYNSLKPWGLYYFTSRLRLHCDLRSYSIANWFYYLVWTVNVGVEVAALSYEGYISNVAFLFLFFPQIRRYSDIDNYIMILLSPRNDRREVHNDPNVVIYIQTICWHLFNLFVDGAACDRFIFTTFKNMLVYISSWKILLLNRLSDYLFLFRDLVFIFDEMTVEPR